MEVEPRQILIYSTANGKEPFTEWLNSLRDRKGRAKIDERIERVQAGNLGDYSFIEGGEGVYELRINFAGGYRIYFGQVGSTIILLLCGGDKNSQKKDIRKAKKYWKDYRKRQK